MASSLADTEHILFLDTRTLARQVILFPIGAEALVIDSEDLIAALVTSLLKTLKSITALATLVTFWFQK